MQKIIGTLVPMSALFSSVLPKYDKGTFATGLIFLDWLKKTNQSAWQVLPLYETQLELGSQTKHIPSPYKSYGIGLAPKYLHTFFADVYPTEEEKHNFISENHEWIHDYVLFCALRDYFKTDDWRVWDDGLRSRNPKTLTEWSELLSKKIDTYIITQWRLHTSYAKLRSKAKKLGIILIGDISFYVSLQSPLVWANQDIFQIKKDGNMSYVSGAPGGAKSLFGRQIWGHPLYNWENKNCHKAITAFWKMRLAHISKLFDFVRFDYAKGFFQHDAIDIKNPNGDTYKKGPGSIFFKELILFNNQNGVTSFAEDCGRNLEQLQLSMKKLHIPGVKIFRFGFDEKKGKINEEYIRPAMYQANSVAYTTMHDTETLLGFLHSISNKQKQTLAERAHVSYDSNDTLFAKKLRNAVIASPANVVIVPIQDWLLTTDRINVPGTELAVNDPNWHYRLKTPIEELPTRF